MKLALPADPRPLQIAFLLAFFAASVGLGVAPWWEAALTLPAALLAQLAFERGLGLPGAGPLSPAITALGVAILLRTDLPWLPPLAAGAGIASKFLVRLRGKHVFNPGAFAVTAAMLATRHAWLSPSQWGERAVVLAWLAMLGLMVAHRAFRLDVSVAFLAVHAALKLARVVYLHQPLAVLAHQLEAGSLLVFAFFMLSDPKTTPDDRAGRVAYAAAVAGLGFFLQHALWVQGAPVWALFFLSPLVPLVDLVRRAPRFAWARKESACPPLASPLSPL